LVDSGCEGNLWRPIDKKGKERQRRRGKEATRERQRQGGGRLQIKTQMIGGGMNGFNL